MQDALALRHRVIATMREILNDRDFLEIETPDLTRSTPEGARDYLVPARVQPGTFYALPQSPQLFKQLLMIGGLERYYQIARCFRDEDLRADRQPEFTQLDLEMSFVTEDDVIAVMEAVMGEVFERDGFAVAPPPWPRMTFAEAMSRYGIDRPDTRFGLELHDLGDALARTGVQGLRGRARLRRGRARDQRGPARAAALRARRAHRAGKAARRQGLVWAFVQEGEEGWRSPIAKFLSAEEIAALSAKLGASPGDLLLIVADKLTTAGQALSALRLELGRRFGLIDSSRHEILWVVEFPAFFWNPEEGRWDSLAPSVHGADRRPRRSRQRRLPGVRPRARWLRDRRRVDPYPSAVRSRSGCSSCSGLTPTRRRRGSGSCSTRSDTGRRRTAGSRWGSTGSSPRSRAASRSAT